MMFFYGSRGPNREGHVAISNKINFTRVNTIRSRDNNDVEFKFNLSLLKGADGFKQIIL